MAGADSVEKLEDVIVRSAEQVAGQIKAAKEAVSTVIFGQDRVIENTLVTILSGGHALLIGVPGLAKTKLVETLGVAALPSVDRGREEGDADRVVVDGQTLIHDKAVRPFDDEHPVNRHYRSKQVLQQDA